ncbi:MAG: hypothetical protein ABIP94_24115, partial [Planctomycetota bacterium]
STLPAGSTPGWLYSRLALLSAGSTPGWLYSRLALLSAGPTLVPPMQQLLAIAVALSAVSLLPAQQTNLTAHPQESVQSGNANYSPFGVFSTGSGAEARAHILVPANELPGPGAVLTGIELCVLTSGTVTYASLEISASPTPATSLSNTFANNIVGTPTVVLQATSLQVAYSSAAWVGIQFTQPYVHDGVSALLLDVKKVVQQAPTYQFVTMNKTSYPPRNDRPQMAYVFGGPGSGQNNALTATSMDSPISFRLLWSGMPTLRNRADTGASGNNYNIGGSTVMTVAGDPGDLWVLAAGVGFLPSPVAIPGIAGTFRLNGPVVYAGGVLDAAGQGVLAANLPNNPSVVGFYLVHQAATVDVGTGAIVLTNGMDHFVNS